MLVFLLSRFLKMTMLIKYSDMITINVSRELSRNIDYNLVVVQKPNLASSNSMNAKGGPFLFLRSMNTIFPYL
jgi:hypothetical protein